MVFPWEGLLVMAFVLKFGTLRSKTDSYPVVRDFRSLFRIDSSFYISGTLLNIYIYIYILLTSLFLYLRLLVEV